MTQANRSTIPDAIASQLLEIAAQSYLTPEQVVWADGMRYSVQVGPLERGRARVKARLQPEYDTATRDREQIGFIRRGMKAKSR